MNDRDYKLIAQTMDRSTLFAVYYMHEAARTQHALMCNELANRFAEQDTSFDQVRFLKACGLPNETVKAL